MRAMAVKQRKKLKPKAKAKPRTNAKPKSGSKARSRVQSRPGPKPRAKKIPSNLKSLPLKQLVAAVRGHLVAPKSHGVIVFQRNPPRIDSQVTIGA